ncbi:class I SAM-dependent methyltransferase [Haloferax marisrubri]|uniref:Class I SAM-dependent methyltransferase n=1 Tax=Haloferax marisrubri TaxID=1544719 RepID=A0A2P4NTQ4_9EURY|nr:class I SAM-dependent methyltransferase [Haloferax marisrubri]POG56544.1 class I SAM-dependent methyltransferase [Haloferax marisrubri]
MDVPTTVTAALDDRPVRGAVCLEAGAGTGNTTAGLLDAGAKRVYAVTNDPEHATLVRDRVAPSPTDRARTVVLEADVRSLPLADDSVDVVTAHGLFNLVSPESLAAVARELTRVAAPGCHLVVDDYEPHPDDAAVRELFALENAASQLARGRPALTFYPADALRALFSGHGWRFDRELTLLDPVPWSESHVEAHASVAKSLAAEVPGEMGGWLADQADRVADAVESESTGEMYSVAMRLSDSRTDATE